MYFIYNFLMITGWIFQLPVMLYKMIFKKDAYIKIKSYMEIVSYEIKNKLKDKEVIWIHMASVGETVAAKPIIKEIKNKYPNAGVVISCNTSGGMAMAKSNIKNVEGYIYFPFDMVYFVRKILDALNPKAVIIIETELWPNLLKSTAQKNIPVYIMNGRISEKSMGRYMMIKGFISRYFYNIRAFCMISKEDADRIIKLGANPEKVKITGNTKYERTGNPISQEFINEWNDILKIKNTTKLIVAGSTHSKEEKILCKMFKDISSKRKDVKMVVATRNISRSNEVEKIFKNSGIEVKLRTQIKKEDDAQVIILDTIGELGQLYSIADIVFIGGSLVPAGGHNLLEAAAYGKPIAVGPYMFNFKEIHELFSKEKACKTVKDENQLIETFNEFFENEEKFKKMGNIAMKIINENRGSAKRDVDIFGKTFTQNC